MDEKKNLEEVKQNNIKTSENKNQNKETVCRCNKTQYWVIALVGFVVLVLLFGGICGAFFLTRSTNKQFRGQQKMEKMGGNRMKDGHGKGNKSKQKKSAIEGKVTAANDKVFNIDQNGQTKNIQISDSTRFPVDSANKVVVGDTVVIFGEQDSSGTIQAIRIIVNPSANQ